MRYRADVDGLRAVAVAGVIAFHAFPAAVPGGFTGVDVFFVISGYLISSVVLDAIERGEFTFRGFFARRVRRLFPALTMVVSATLAIAWFVMLGVDYMRLGGHAAAAEVFAANIAFWRESGYFDVSADRKPLLHLWSLGVEEQFYLTWPLIVLLTVRRRVLLPLLVTLALVSFILNVWTVSTDAAAAFYLPHTRAWELLAGALLACVGSQRLHALPPRVRQAASVIGIALIAASFLLVRPDRAFPGWWALMPVGGAFLLVLAGPGTWVTTQLARRGVVWIGLISYPLYLWHWPLLSLARSASRTEPSPPQLGVLIGLSVVLAWLTYRFVERPVRFGGWRASPRAVPALASASVVIALAGAAVSLGAVRTSIDRSSAFASTYTYDFRNGYRGQRCQLGGAQEPENFDPACVDAGFGQDGTRSVLIWGDSHAAHLYPGLRAIQRQERLTLAQFTRDGCEPLVFDATDQCRRLNAFVARRLPALRPDVVILSAQWSSVPPPLMRTLDTIRRTTDAQIIVVGPVPTWGGPLPEILVAYEREHPGEALPAYLPGGSAVGREMDLRLRRSFDNSAVTYVSPMDTMCHADGCLAVVNGALTAWDDAHLTDEGSKIMAMALLRAMRR